MEGVGKLEETQRVKMKLFILLLLLFASFSLAATTLITSAGREFSTGVWDSSPGKWHYEAKYNGNGSTSVVTMGYDSVNTRWREGVSAGNGFVQNASVTFGAETGVSLIVDPGTVGGSHAFPHNTTVNWTSNFTGKINFTGWFQRTSLTANNYNISIWKNGDLNQSYIKTDSVNYTFEARRWDVATGDYIAIVIASSVIDQDPYINLTAYVEADLTAPGTPTRTLTVDKNNYTEGDSANLSIAVNSLNLNTNVTSNFSVKYANGTVVWFLQSINDTQTNPVYLSYSLPVGAVSAVSNFNETIVFNVSTNLSLSNGTWINFNNISSALLHKIVLQNCRIIASTSPSALTFTTYDENTLNYLNGTYYQLTLNASLPGKTFQRNYSFIWNNTIPVGSFMQANTTVCIYPEWQTYYVQGLILYTNNSYVVRNYRVFSNLSEVRKNVTLYSIQNSTFSSSTAEVDFTLKDYAGNLLSGYTIQVQRYFVGNGSFIGVAQAVTDYAGRAITYLDTSAQSFRVIVLDADGNFVQSFSPVVLTASLLVATNTYGLTLTIQPQDYSIYPWFGHVSANCAFNNATSLLSCDVNDATQIGVSSTLTVQNLSINGWSTICTSSATGASATLVCSVPGWNNSIFKYQLLIYDSNGVYFQAGEGILDYRVSPFGSVSWGAGGWLIALILCVALFALGFQNMNAALAMLALAIIGISWLNIITISLYAEISLLLLIGLMMWKSRA